MGVSWISPEEIIRQSSHHGKRLGHLCGNTPFLSGKRHQICEPIPAGIRAGHAGRTQQTNPLIARPKGRG
jgi:hypothetical protein